MHYGNSIFIKFLAPVILLTVIASCGNDAGNTTPDDFERTKNSGSAADNTTDPTLIEIRDLEQKNKNNPDPDKATLLRLLKAYQEYYNRHSTDTVAGNYLFEAANIAQKLDKHQKAIELFTNFHDGFPKSSRCDKAAYNIAYIYDEKLNDKKNAELYYNKVIELYPNSMWAGEARAALKILNMSDEELIRYLEEKNKKVAS